jgi:hypothetical protein
MCKHYKLNIDLSDVAKRYLQHVEDNLYDDCIYWNEVPSLKCERGCDYFTHIDEKVPQIDYRSRDILTEASCMHEVFHLIILKLGFPYLKIIESEADQSYDKIDKNGTLINNLFSHSIIFPRLLELNYNPYPLEESGIDDQFKKINKEVEKPIDRYFKIFVSLFYVRSQLENKNNELREMVREYLIKNAKINDCILQAEKIIEIIKSYTKGKNRSEYKKGLEETIKFLSLGKYFEIVQFINIDDKPDTFKYYFEN